MIFKGKATWYSFEDIGGNKNVAMMSCRTCPECGGTGGKMVCEFEGCKRCLADGKLVNQLPFNKMGMECAMPESMIEEHGLTFGQLIQVRRVNNGKIPIQLRDKIIVVRLVDIGPADRLYKQGRVIDLTEFAFGLLEDCRTGVIEVEVEPL